MSDIAHRTIKTNGINMHIAEAGDGPLVVLLHGFPELWYSWRHQLPALAAAGYHAVAPDNRGYGQTDAPYEIEAYSMRQMTADIVGVLDALGEREAVVVGHDWGSPIAWNCALLYPDRFRAVAALSVPFLPRGPMPPLQMFKQMFANNFFYIVYFQEPGVAEAEFEADVRRAMRLFLYMASGEAPENSGPSLRRSGSKLFEGVSDPPESSPWLSEADLNHFVTEFERTGFRGPLNRYRNMDSDWTDLAELAGAKVEQPALFIAGERDAVIKLANPEMMKPSVPNLRQVVMLPGCGHWTQQERPKEVNDELIAFLSSLN
jgi:pimeloyl-ACP methyl ester carboxylesterase